MATATLLTPLGPAHATTVRVPRRFDTHQVDSVAGQLRRALDMGADHLVVDGSDADFVDHDAVDLLVSHVDGAGEIRIERPSLAMQITLELLGHAAPAQLEEAA